MNHEINLQTIADEIKAAQDHCKLIVPLTSRLSQFSNDEAYAVAQLIHEMRIKEGAVPVGRKIGFTNREMWSIYGVCEPIWGYIYDTSVLQLAGSMVRCHIGQFAEPKIEPEIVVHFGTSPPMNADPAEVLASIDWIAHGIEIVQSHFPGWKFQAADTIADWGLHAMLISKG
jgi:2-keto-4-pentenoate hydratase